LKENEFLLDPSDRWMISDFYKSMAGRPNCFSIHLEHFMDEFGMYDSEYRNIDIISAANRFVYDSIG
jgi:hypothetical protein